MKSFNEYLTEKKNEFDTLKANKIPLTDEERTKVMKAGAVWRHGPNGEKTPAVWKSKNASGQTRFICNTHRAGAVKDTLAAAISSYKFIKTTA